MLNITLTSHLPQSMASVLYTFYQIIFILMIIPGGYLVEIKNIKRLLIITTFIESGAFILLGIAHSFWLVLLVQIIFGCLIPISHSTEYAYLLKFSSKRERGHRIALYSNTIRAATVAGIFIGGVLAHHFGARNILLFAGCIVFVAGFYVLFLVPKITPKYDVRIRNVPLAAYNFKYVLKNLRIIFKNFSFLQILLFIAVPFGLLEEGVLLFSTPLVLAKYHIAHDIIGKLLVLFSIGFFISNKYIAKKTDWLQAERRFMFYGLCGTAIGLMFMAGFALNFSLWTIAFGLMLLGIFRGFTFAPSIAYISKNNVATKLGKNVAISTHKLLETCGRVIGPLLLMQILLGFNYSAKSFLVVGIFFVVLALSNINLLLKQPLTPRHPQA